ncbi:MAG: hypothetical protein WA902_18200 [Thermosynechococcaceae cyanobacterium]
MGRSEITTKQGYRWAQLIIDTQIMLNESDTSMANGLDVPASDVRRWVNEGIIPTDYRIKGGIAYANEKTIEELENYIETGSWDLDPDAGQDHNTILNVETTPHFDALITIVRTELCGDESVGSNGLVIGVRFNQSRVQLKHANKAFK